jgi:hypothetical protein
LAATSDKLAKIAVGVVARRSLRTALSAVCAPVIFLYTYSTWV